jgi:phospholipase C
MTKQIMTLGQETKRFILRGQDPLNTLNTDFREIAFQCQFVEGAANGTPKIRVSVLEVNKGLPEHIRIKLIPPDRPGIILGSQPLHGRISQPSDVEFGTRGDLVITDWFTSDDWFIPDPLPDPIDNPQNPRKVVTHSLVPGVDPQGLWRMRLYNLSYDQAEFIVNVQYPATVQTLETTKIPFQLINRVFAEVLLLMGLRIEIKGRYLSVHLNPEFQKLTGINRVTSVKLSLPVKRNVNLKSFVARMLKGTRLALPVIQIGIDFEEQVLEVKKYFVTIEIENLSIWVNFHLYPPYPFDFSTDFFSTAMVRHNGKNVPPKLLGVSTSVFYTAKLNRKIAGFIARSKIEELRKKLEESINKVLLQKGIREYIHDVLINLVQRDHVLHGITADNHNIIVQHHALPGRILSASDGPGRVLDTGSGVVFGEVASTEGATGRRRLREGEVDHIVILMMENRSFDHMLGYRSLKGHPSVRGLMGNEQNSLIDGSPPYVVHHLTQTHGISCPGHGFKDTIEQIANGEMSGFVNNYARRDDANDPSLVMGYYTEAELPMYEFFANNFAVCDAWYSSHPGATWPNRFCATTGTAPERDNFDIADNRIGYFKGTSIFDFLTAFGVDWAYAEGNVGFIRIFNRYRLDIQHVIPFKDYFDQKIEDTLENRIQNGRLPSVTYIDPRYIDIPPSWDSNDDLPPGDVCHGQALVRDVFNMLSSAPTWSRTLLVITYDEHGGFFDHIPPPGTPAAADPSPLPRITPEGADHLGIRVPAFLVSPWV